MVPSPVVVVAIAAAPVVASSAGSERGHVPERGCGQDRRHCREDRGDRRDEVQCVDKRHLRHGDEGVAEDTRQRLRDRQRAPERVACRIGDLRGDVRR